MTRLGSFSSTYLTPIKSDGTVQPVVIGRGKFTLAANTTYYYILSAADAPYTSVQITGYDAGLVITSATIQDCNHDGADVTDFSQTAGEWSSEKPPNSYAAPDGTGWSADSTGVGAATGAGLGGILWHFVEAASARVRLEIKVGSVGGVARVSAAAKS